MVDGIDGVKVGMIACICHWSDAFIVTHGHLEDWKENPEGFRTVSVFDDDREAYRNLVESETEHYRDWAKGHMDGVIARRSLYTRPVEERPQKANEEVEKAIEKELSPQAKVMLRAWKGNLQ